MLIVEDKHVIGDMSHAIRRKVSYLDVVGMKERTSWLWYLLIFLGVFVNCINLFYYENVLKFHTYLIIGVLMLIFRSILVDTFFQDYSYYDVLDEDKDHIYVEDSEVNYDLFLYEDLKPRFDIFTLFHVLIRYILFVFFAYWLDHSLLQDYIVIISLILSLSLFVSSYYSYDFDYRDYHFCLNFSLCCLCAFVFIHMVVLNEWILLTLFSLIVSLLIYCLKTFHYKMIFKIMMILLSFIVLY